MKLTVNRISDMRPCESRFNNFTSHYPNFEGSFADFLNLEQITYEDKVWVGVRLLSRNQLITWSIACAESVKHIYEDKYPQDKCLTKLFDYLKSIEDFTKLTQAQRDKIWSLRSIVRNATATSDASAATAATAATSAAATATAATAAYAADAATYAAGGAAKREEQQNLNLMLLASFLEDGQ